MQLDSWIGTLPMVLALSDSWLTNRVIWEVALNQVMLLLYQYSPIMQTKWKSENNDYQIDTNHALCTLPAQSVWQSLIKFGHQHRLHKTSQQVWRIRQVCSFLLLRRASPKIIAILHGNQRSPQSLIDRGREPSNCPFATIHNAVDSEFPSAGAKN